MLIVYKFLTPNVAYCYTYTHTDTHSRYLTVYFQKREESKEKIIAELKIVWLNNWVIEWGFYLHSISCFSGNSCCYFILFWINILTIHLFHPSSLSLTEDFMYQLSKARQERVFISSLNLEKKKNVRTNTLSYSLSSIFFQ